MGNLEFAFSPYAPSWAHFFEEFRLDHPCHHKQTIDDTHQWIRFAGLAVVPCIGSSRATRFVDVASVPMARAK
jgi:hypothetical protein